MKIRDVERLFGLQHGIRHVSDHYAGVYSGRWERSSFHLQAIRYYFGFDLRDGDVVCAVLLRRGPKPKKKAPAYSAD